MCWLNPDMPEQTINATSMCTMAETKVAPGSRKPEAAQIDNPGLLLSCHHTDLISVITALPDTASSQVGKNAHLLCFLLVAPKQGPQVQQGVGGWGGLPLLSSHCNVLHGAVMNIALQALLIAAFSHLQNVHLIPTMLQMQKCQQSTKYMTVFIYYNCGQAFQPLKTKTS